jgi:hypothetical protein
VVRGTAVGVAKPSSELNGPDHDRCGNSSVIHTVRKPTLLGTPGHDGVAVRPPAGPADLRWQAHMRGSETYPRRPASSFRVRRRRSRRGSDESLDHGHGLASAVDALTPHVRYSGTPMITNPITSNTATIRPNTVVTSQYLRTRRPKLTRPSVAVCADVGHPLSYPPTCVVTRLASDAWSVNAPDAP